MLIMVQTISCEKIPDEDQDPSQTAESSSSVEMDNYSSSSSSSSGIGGNAKYCGYGASCHPDADCEQSPKKCYRLDGAYPECPTGVIHSGQFAGSFASEEECIANGFPFLGMCIRIPPITCASPPCDNIPDPIPCNDLPSSSSGSGIIEGEPITYEGRTYKTVKIGNQTWMAENLNYDAPGSECYDPCPECDWEYDCHIYGRFYDWATAMKLDGIFNNASIAYKNCFAAGIPFDENTPSSNCPVGLTLHHQGICPLGWHLPKKQEWEQLYSYVGSNHGEDYVGSRLKAENGWADANDCFTCSQFNGHCPAVCLPSVPNMDTYGFAALPGGFIYGASTSVVPVDPGIGRYGAWWASSESATNTTMATHSNMSFNSSGAGLGESAKNSKMSVRCVKD